MPNELNDDELKALLKQWSAPAAAPARVERAVMNEVRLPWWKWLWTGTIRVPAPLALALVAVVAALAWMRLPQAPKPVEPDMLQAGLEPVSEWKPRIMRSSYVSQ